MLIIASAILAFYIIEVEVSKKWLKLLLLEEL